MLCHLSSRQFLILLTAAFLLLIIPAGASTPVYGPGPVIINESGTYELMNDITSGTMESLIVINASDVIFDGRGHTLHSADGEGIGILVNEEGEDQPVPISNVTIRNMHLDNWTYGILMMNTRDSAVQGVTSTGTEVDIFLIHDCMGNTISGNTFSDSQFGIVTYDSCNSNTISDNTITDSMFGMYLFDSCNSNTISDNTITGNYYGIAFLTETSHNTVKGNTIINNIMGGLAINSLSENTIYNNHFSNPRNVFFEDAEGTNSWNIEQTAGPNIMGGPSIGGNFWGTPDGTGFSETDPDMNNDGFCDDQYPLGTGNIDRLPLHAWPPAITAGFYAFGHVGQAPYPVRFMDQSTGSPTAWKWDFGDGRTSTEQNPTHVFNRTGAYNVALTASSDRASDTSIQYRCIIVNAVPVANFTANATAGSTPFTVQFTDQSTGGTSYQWQFGDGTTSADQNPIHTYTVPGTCTVTLTIFEPDYGSVFTQKPGYITVTAPPSIGLTANVTAGLSPLAVQFNESDPGSARYFYWQFGDGSTSYEPNPVHVYGTAGRYTVSVMTVGSNGTETKTLGQYINVTSPVTPTPTTLAPTNTTVIPTNTTVAPTVAGGTPYNGPHTLPGLLQAEDYDLGGEGVAYHDTTPGNEGGVYRHDDVDIEQLDTDGSPNVGWIRSGEWLTYTVNVATAGTYDAGFRVASSHAGSSVRMYVDDGTTPVATVNVPDTGDWPVFQTVPVPVTLPAGQHRLKFSFPAGYVNINWVSFTPASK